MFKKYESKRSTNIGSGESYDSVEIIKSEENDNHIKVITYQERRRTKEEYIQLYENIIKELKKFNW